MSSTTKKESTKKGNAKKRSKKTKIVDRKDLSKYLQEKDWISMGPVDSQPDKYLIKYADDWERWEIHVRRFLMITGFQDVGGGMSSILGGHQIDAFGGFESTFIAVECKHKNYPGFKGLKDTITLLDGKRADIEADVISRYHAKYSEIVLILALNEIKVSDIDQKRAKEKGIFLWDENYIKSYEQIAQDLKGHVQYHILRDLKAKPSLAPSVKIPALKVNWYDNDVYLFYAEPQDLLRICYVFRRESARDRAYQRGLNPTRLSEIGTFIDNKGYFANNLIINIKGKLSWAPVDFADAKKSGLSKPKWLDVGMLTFPNEYCSCQVIDGQHRLYGYAASKNSEEPTQLPVAAFYNLDEVSQARLFILINQEQKRVDPNLIWDLYSEIYPEDYLGVISKVAKRLANDPQSPFYGEIFVPGVVGGKKSKPIKLANLCKGIDDRKLIWDGSDYDKILQNLWDGNARHTEERAYDLLKRYFRIISKELAFDWDQRTRGLLFNNNGINLLLRILVEIIKDCDGEPPDAAEITNYMNPLCKFLKDNHSKIDSARRRCSSEAGRADVALRLILEISKEVYGFAGKTIQKRGVENIPEF